MTKSYIQKSSLSIYRLHIRPFCSCECAGSPKQSGRTKLHNKLYSHSTTASNFAPSDLHSHFLNLSFAPTTNHKNKFVVQSEALVAQLHLQTPPRLLLGLLSMLFVHSYI